jgi:NAD kinase
MKVLLVYSEKLSENHLNAVDKIKNLIEKLNIDYISVEVRDLKKELLDVDLIITAGGDGTFIRAASYLKETLILGINSEPEFSEGALTSLNDDELDILEDILKGNYSILKRQRIKVILNGKELNQLALNDVYIGSTTHYHASRYLINFKGNEEEQRSSGILFSTGSGSSAWYKSAGGEVFGFDEKKIKFLVREPFSGRIFQPKIIREEILEGEKIKVIAKRHEGGVISLDSNFNSDFNIPDVVELEISEFPLNVVIRK